MRDLSFIFLIIFLNKTDDQMLDTEIQGLSFFGTEGVKFKSNFTIQHLVS